MRSIAPEGQCRTQPKNGRVEHSAPEGQCSAVHSTVPQRAEHSTASKGQCRATGGSTEKQREKSGASSSAGTRDCFRLQNKLLQSKISEEKILRIFAQNEQMLAEKQSFPEQNLLS